MSDILTKICELKKKELESLKNNQDFVGIKRKTKVRDFLSKLKNDNNFNYNVIAEIKRASPSKGVICEDFDPIKIAKDYEKAGAACLSVLTEKTFFQGDLTILKSIKNLIRIPILRKDFIIDEWQIYESYYNEADCILLIVAALSDSELSLFYNIAKKLKLDVIVEVHNNEELERALNLNVECIGINNRNLKTLEVDLTTFMKLSKKIPSDILKICESGISDNKQLKEFKRYGADAFLVGETLMKSDDIYKNTLELIKK